MRVEVTIARYWEGEMPEELNANRRSWYGIRAGDRVTYPIAGWKERKEATVKELCLFDKNKCLLEFDDGTRMNGVCEWCRRIDVDT
jgi:hypothetical protein